jgi:L-amino acid N-acyltransferase YncA
MENETIDFTIRLAIDNDFKSIYQIWLDGVGNSFDTDCMEEKQIQEKFQDNFHKRKGIFNFWVALDTAGKILGWQSLIKCFDHPFKENIYAEASTYISKDNRFKGAGKSLLEFVMKEAENSDLEYVIGFVAVENEAAKKITEETGWVNIGKIPPSKKGNNKIIKSFLVRPV